MSGKSSVRGKTRFYTLAIGTVIVIFSVIYGFKWYQNYKTAKYEASLPAQYQTISTAPATKQAWYSHEGSVAIMTAVQGVNVNAQVSGKILQIEFKGGQIVHKGEELVRLEDFAEIQQLNNYLATMKVNKITMDRQYKVYKAGLISQEEYDQARAAYKEALANVKMEQANIDYKHVKAPFTGMLGINRLNPGQYLNAGDTVVSLQTLQPIYADFSLPMQFFNTTQKGQQVSLSLPSMPNKTFVGRVLSKSALVNSTTQNFTVRGVFLNKENLLKPGMFADADLRMGKEKQVVLIPRTGIVYSLYGNSIYTVTAINGSKKEKLYKVRQIPADLGEVVGTKVIVKSGLKVGEQVVVSGQIKVVNGATVKVNNAVRLRPLKKSELMKQ